MATPEVSGLVAYEHREIAALINAIDGVIGDENVRVTLVEAETSRGQKFTLTARTTGRDLSDYELVSKLA